MREHIKESLQRFCIINTGITIGAAGFITFVQKQSRLGVEIFWQLMIVSLVATLADIIFYSNEELSKKQILIRSGVHYIVINILVLYCAHLFKWFEGIEAIKILSFILCIFLVYLFVWIGTYTNDTKTAKKLNEKINEYNKE